MFGKPVRPGRVWQTGEPGACLAPVQCVWRCWLAVFANRPCVPLQHTDSVETLWFDSNGLGLHGATRVMDILPRKHELTEIVSEPSVSPQ